ncbi:DUF4376 domain-containing protein [Desulfovibrio sp. OttesenSCG-928-A18]|nr:DUF4376 domain-containing protein [Desulfovibrio sp. OttesenSCG-928-A18]
MNQEPSFDDLQELTPAAGEPQEIPLAYFYNQAGAFVYVGEMLPGDRPATEAEVTAAIGTPYFRALNLAWERIKAARDARLERGGLVWNGYLVSIDKEATDRMTSTALQFVVGVVESVRWKMSDGAYADLDREAFLAMSAAAGAVVQACYAVEEAKRAQVAAMDDADLILAWLAEPANLLTGWPGDGA